MTVVNLKKQALQTTHDNTTTLSLAGLFDSCFSFRSFVFFFLFLLRAIDHSTGSRDFDSVSVSAFAGGFLLSFS
jgi:hypothetical protein